LQLIPHVGERQRDAHERNRRVLHRNRDVQHVHLQRRAVAAGAAEAGRARVEDFRTPRVVLHRRDSLERLERIADDRAVGRNEGRPRADQLADAVGLVVELRHRRERRPPRDEFGGQPRLRHERALDAPVDLPPHRRREERAGDGERQYRGRQGGDEELRLKRPHARVSGAGSTSL